MVDHGIGHFDETGDVGPLDRVKFKKRLLKVCEAFLRRAFTFLD